MIENVKDVKSMQYGIYIDCMDSVSSALVELSLNYGSVSNTIEHMNKGDNDIFYLQLHEDTEYDEATSSTTLTWQSATALRNKLTEMLHALGVE